MLWHIEVKFCIWLSSHELQNKKEYHQVSSIFVGFMTLLSFLSHATFLKELCIFFELRKYAVVHSFPHFSSTWFDIFSWKFTYDFVTLTTDKVWVLSCLSLALRPSSLPTFSALFSSDKLSCNLNLTFDSLMCSFCQVLYKNSLLKCKWREYDALFVVLWYILRWKHDHPNEHLLKYTIVYYSIL